MTTQTDKILQFLSDNPANTESRTNERGNTLHYGFLVDETRYLFDFNLCKGDDGWEKFDIKSDAPWFGSWIHRAERLVVTYAEGDVHLIICPTEESFTAEVQKMCDFHDKPPPSFVVFDQKTGLFKRIYDGWRRP